MPAVCDGSEVLQRRGLRWDANVRRRHPGQLQFVSGHRRAGRVLGGSAHIEPEREPVSESERKPVAGAKHISVGEPFVHSLPESIIIAIYVPVSKPI